MVGWRIPNNKEASCPTFFDYVLDFDPVVEWLVDPDLSPMSISNAGDVKVEHSGDIPAVHEPRADESELSGFPIDEKMDKSTPNPEIIGGGEAVASPDEKIMKMDPLEMVLGSEPTNSMQEKGLNPEGDGGAGSESGDVKMMQSEDIPAVHEPRADESELLRSPIDEKMDKFTLNPEIIGGGEAVAGPDEKIMKMEPLGEPMNSTQEKGSDSEGDGEAGSESESEEESSTVESSSSSSGEEEGDDGGDLVVEVEEGEIMEDLIISSEDEGIVAKGPIKSKNEIEDLPPVPRVEVCLELHHQTSPVGVISSILGNRVIVEGSEKHNPLSEGSILWITETRSPLGMVDEIFGPVKNPYYIVRYNSDTEVPGEVKEGTKVSFVLEFANHVLNDKDVYKKGYDASGENDEEMTGEVEFSDDEKENEYRKSLQQTKRATGCNTRGNGEFAGNKKRNDRRAAKNRKNVRTPNFHAHTATDQSSPVVSGSAHESSGMSSSGCSNRALASGAVAFPMIPSIPQAVQLAASLNHPPDQPLQHLPGSVWPHTLPLQQQLNPLQQQFNAWPNDTLPQQQLGAWALGVLLQQQQQNALAQGFPPLQQLIGVQGGLGGPPYQHLQNPGLNAYPPMPSQQQFGPNSGPPLGEPWINRPFNLLVNPMVTRPFGPTGFGQAQVGSGNAQYPGVSGIFEGQNLAAIGQAGQRPQGFAPGRSSPRGRRLHGRGGRHSFGRGNQPRSG